MQSIQLIANKADSFWKLSVLVGETRQENSLVYLVCKKFPPSFEGILDELLDGYDGVAFGGLRDVSAFFENNCRRFLREQMHEELETLAMTIERLEKQPKTRGQKAAIRCLWDVMLEKQEETMEFIHGIQTRREEQL
uniref:Uncharacterized protein n=1 Tax=Marseillevirus sp. TaxID=2809551 RepID=A0AA96ELI8_9VIRU|nr:hypothetical protein MarFTMF_114 [Marseillevirus sp.]